MNIDAELIEFYKWLSERAIIDDHCRGEGEAECAVKLYNKSKVKNLSLGNVSKSLLHNDNENWRDVVSGYSLEQNLNDAQEHILDDLIKYLNREYGDTFTK